LGKGIAWGVGTRNAKKKRCWEEKAERPKKIVNWGTFAKKKESVRRVRQTMYLPEQGPLSNIIETERLVNLWGERVGKEKAEAKELKKCWSRE